MQQRPVPRVHGRRAHPDGDPQPAPFCASHSTRTSIRCAPRLIADFERREVLFLAGLFQRHCERPRWRIIRSWASATPRRFSLPQPRAGRRRIADLVVWLVKHHLLMSAVAQKQDIHRSGRSSRPFAATVGVGIAGLVCAVILFHGSPISAGRVPRCGNAWKAKLLDDLFRRHPRAFSRRAGPAPRRLADSLHDRQLEARRLLRLYAIGRWRPREKTCGHGSTAV